MINALTEKFLKQKDCYVKYLEKEFKFEELKRNLEDLIPTTQTAAEEIIFNLKIWVNIFQLLKNNERTFMGFISHYVDNQIAVPLDLTIKKEDKAKITRIKNFQCKKCGRKFSYENSYNKHVGKAINAQKRI